VLMCHGHSISSPSHSLLTNITCQTGVFFACVVAPQIDRISLRIKSQYNATETITCSAEGVPRPSVAWIHISGSMRADQKFAGQGKAVLKNLESGDHTWMCTASNTEGSDNYTLTFNGAFCCVTA